jgi:hypothetical protein
MEYVRKYRLAFFVLSLLSIFCSQQTFAMDFRGPWIDDRYKNKLKVTKVETGMSVSPRGHPCKNLNIFVYNPPGSGMAYSNGLAMAFRPLEYFPSYRLAHWVRLYPGPGCQRPNFVGAGSRIPGSLRPGESHAFEVSAEAAGPAGYQPFTDQLGVLWIHAFATHNGTQVTPMTGAWVAAGWIPRDGESIVSDRR